jgi:hypothetical protein
MVVFPSPACGELVEPPPPLVSTIPSADRGTGREFAGRERTD